MEEKKEKKRKEIKKKKTKKEKTKLQKIGAFFNRKKERKSQ